jgi:hypothetical protein
VFHGVLHPIAVSIREAVLALGPLLQRMVAQYGNEVVGMELICRIMFDMQQDYFSWLGQTAAGRVVPAPDFQALIAKVSSHRADSLSLLPSSWYLKLDCPRARPPQPLPETAPAGMREAVGRTPVTNPHPDAGLLRRYAGSGHGSIGAMTAGHTVEFPRHNGAAVCMAWALRGTCYTHCKRKDQHVRYGVGVIRALNALMTTCGVAEAQA